MKLLLTILFTATICYAQTDVRENNPLDTSVMGAYQYGGSYYLVTENGWLLVNSSMTTNDQYTEYYRRIYGDSTIVSPNTIIHPDNSALQFITPVIDVSEWMQGFNPFGDKVYLNTFMIMDSTGRYTFRPGVSGIIEKMYADPNFIK